MSRFHLIGSTIAILTLGFSLAPASARATTIDDPLHGFCGANAQTSTCSDDGKITPTSSLSTFGFYASPNDLTGTNWLVAILVPASATSTGLSFTLSETAGADNGAQSVVVSSPVSATSWTSGDLADYLTQASNAHGLSSANATPSNPFSGFTVENDASVTGFTVYLADLGKAELFDQADSSAPNAPLLSLTGGSFGPGMEIASFLIGAAPGKNQPNIATAPSGVLLGNSDCCNVQIESVAVPEPASILLFGTGLALVSRRLRRRSR